MLMSALQNPKLIHDKISISFRYSIGLFNLMFQVIMSLGASVRISSELDSYIVSLERVIEYTHIASEVSKA